MDSIDFDNPYESNQWPGVAWRVLEWVPLSYDEDGEVETYSDTHVLARMVGDDHVRQLDISTLVALGDCEYCASCGQVGCTAEGS